jgi:hypothetical protein
VVIAESRAAAGQLGRRGQRSLYGQALRRFLAQLFPEWTIAELTSAAQWEHSFSGRYTRGLLTRGQRGWAVIGTGEQENPFAAGGILTYGLIWLDWLRQRHSGRVIEGLKIFVPTDQASPTLLRLAWLDSSLAQWEVYETGEEVCRCDPADRGNLRTTLAPEAAPSPLPPSSQTWAERIQALSSEIETHQTPDGLRRWAIRGLGFARETVSGFVFGVERSQTRLHERTENELEALVEKILRFRRARGDDRAHPYYRLQPERWMQTILTRQVARLGFDLDPDSVCEQVPASSGLERGVMDLLALNRRSRLVVIELKASEDIHLPLQALDYWMRVHWHQQQGEFERHKYFEGRPLSPEPPLLLLVSPALQFHSACETVLRYFAPSIEAVRIGLNENWREELQVVFRSRQGPVSG